jgi:Skp family chaperone for outer membrane proteins
MKRILVIPTAFVLLTIASISAVAQTRPAPAGATSPRPAAPQPTPGATAAVPDTKIAIVDTSMFGDEKEGVTRYLNAVKTVQREFQPKVAELNTLQGRIKAIADEITKLSGNSVVAPQTLQAKQEEGERLQREFKYKKEQADADVEKRYSEVVGPITTDIGKALDQYASQHGLTMILDISKLLPAVLSVNPAMDITRTFIAEYNRKNP